ncbi:MAG: DNA polymerase I [Deltaproteobacteria bacterium]|nr:DNA polymerase I [Deltaproteobacteria bacterium]MBT6489240.1 DNA polymerase I [Deltaproteobacteria bacterium]
MSNSGKLFLIDGSAYIFRAYYGIRPLSTSAGVPTNAVVGFARMVARLIKEQAPDYIVMVFDTKEPNFRHELFPDYKANRDAPPEDLIPQFALIHQLVDAMDLVDLSMPGYEADDIIGTLSRRATASKIDTVIVSSDKDLMQLVNDSVTMYDPMREKVYDREAVTEKFGVGPEFVADALALAGDTSDNIPGVPKVGLKTAAKLINRFGDVEAVIAGVETIEKPKAAERSVTENQASARLSKELTLLDKDAPVEWELESYTFRTPNKEKLTDFFDLIEARALLRDFKLDDSATSTKAATPKAKPAQEAAQSLPVINRDDYRTILDETALDEFIQAIESQKLFSFDLETTSLNAHRAEIVGFAMAVEGQSAVYVPVAHRYLGMPKQLSHDLVIDKLKPILESSSVGKVGQNLKYDMNVLARIGVRLEGIREDSMLAAYILNATLSSYSLDALAREELQHETISYKSLTGTGKKQIGFDEVAVEDASRYASEDADIAYKLCEILAKRMSSSSMAHVYRDLELPLVPVLAKMEQTGIKIDVPHLQALSTEFATRLREIEAKAHALIGETINLASPKQLSHVFFEKLGYPVIKKTKTGYSTDQEVLETLAKDYELPGVVLEYRMLAKLKSTYVDALPKLADSGSGRVHTSYNQTGTATGRLSSTDPNLQNIPIRSEDGKRIRKAFVADEGWCLVAADYSQIELRVMAHLCQDEAFVEAFRQGEDIHSRTAREILTGGAEVDSESRRRAKAINFGILYGLSEFGLAKQLGISRSEAKDYISAYFGRYPKIRHFLDRCIEEGRENGYVSTLSGRQRALPELKSKNGNIRKGAERIAMNTPIQGSAADLIKMAMLKVAERLEKENMRSRLLLQVHDELVLESPLEERDALVNLVREEMSSVMELSVPLVVDVGFGQSWAEAH